MTVALLAGEPPIEITLRRSARARRMTLRVAAAGGRVTLTIPGRISSGEALRFAAERRPWIEKALDRAVAEVPVAEGMRLPVDGRPRTIVAGGRRPVLERDCLALPPGRLAAAALAFLKDRARSRMAAYSDAHAGALGVRFTRIAIGDPRSRWGSCSTSGRLMYSLRLAMAPDEVQDYVAAHEVAHLLRMDHSPSFWKLVEGRCPEWRARREWLTRHGAALHAYRFDSAGGP